jgi:large subunit ribosomal protein L22
MNRRERRKQRREKEAEERLADKHKSAILRYLRVAPRKVRAVTKIIRGCRVEQALSILDFTNRAAAGPLAKMLRAAVANAAASGDIDVDTLVVKEIQVNQGPTLKRFIPRAMGRATPVQKKTSHVSFLLEERS